MPKKENCKQCDKAAFLNEDKLCRTCQDKQKPKEEEEEKIDFSKIPKVGSREKATRGQALKSLAKAQSYKLRSLMITQDFPRFKFVVPDMDDYGWASSVMEVFEHNFAPTKKDIFTNLVVVSGEEMVFRPPGDGQAYPGPSITIWDPVSFGKEGSGGKGALSDWICVLCHEIIHYLHWRWTIIPPPDPKYNAGYEDMVSGQPTPEFVIPLYKEKELSGLKELSDPPTPFTENAFRVKKFGLAMRKSYDSVAEFGKNSTKVDLEELYPCSSMFVAKK